MSSVKTPMLLAAGTACVIAIAVVCVFHLQKDKQNSSSSSRDRKKQRKNSATTPSSTSTTTTEAAVAHSTTAAAAAAAATTDSKVNGSFCSPSAESTGDEVRLDSGIGSPKGTPSIENRSSSEQTVEQASDLIEESFSAVCYSKANGVDSSSLFVETSAISAAGNDESVIPSFVLKELDTAVSSPSLDEGNAAAEPIEMTENTVEPTQSQAKEEEPKKPDAPETLVRSKKETPSKSKEGTPIKENKSSRRKSAAARKEAAMAQASSSTAAPPLSEAGVTSRKHGDDRNNNTRRQSTGSDVVTGSEGSADSKADSGCHSVSGIYQFKYEFELPSDLCGRLIGRQGSTVKDIKEKTGATITVRPHMNPAIKRVFVISKQEDHLKLALAEIRKKFPLKQFPLVTLAMADRSAYPSMPVPSYLPLPEDSDTAVFVTDIEGANHMYVQLPANNTYGMFMNQEKLLEVTYSPTPGHDPPSLPGDLIRPNAICVIEDSGTFYRAVIAGNPNEENVRIKFVDYGGYDIVHVSRLKQIRSDFLLVPFQAIEIRLTSIEPANDDGIWGQDAIDAVHAYVSMEHYQVLARLLSYVDDIPSVELMCISSGRQFSLAAQLVEDGFARWVNVNGIDEAAPSSPEVEEASGPRFSPADFPSL